jgi:hypothetical protein
MMNLMSQNPKFKEQDVNSYSALLSPSPLKADNLMPKINSVFQYIRSSNYEGHDLFDGLNSQIFKTSLFYKSKLLRLALIQFCKKSSTDFRAILMVSKGFNPKGGGLFLLGMLNLYQATGQEVYSNEAYILFQRLRHSVLQRRVGNAWGYNFDWQARAFFVPVGTPNLVTSVYVGRALLAYHQVFNDLEALELALGVADFILNEMVKFEDENFACFNYIPGEDTEVHNASLLGASYLAEVFCHLPEVRQPAVREKILKATRFAVLDINPDGSWPYGTQPFHRWVDNFHTAFNIESLYRIQHHLQTDEFTVVYRQVTEYYMDHLFTQEGIPKYYNNSTYPIDVHVLAESIVLMQLLRLTAFEGKESRRLAIENSLLTLCEEFQDSKGYFYYQKMKCGWNRIPYIRWGQAWMFYAMSSCLTPS